MPTWTLWGTVGVFGAFVVYIAVREAVKVRRVAHRERRLTEEARRSADA